MTRRSSYVANHLLVFACCNTERATTLLSKYALFLIDCCIILQEERNTYASLFSRRACSALGAESLPRVGQPDAAGHLSAGLSDRSFPLWGRSLGPGCQ